jgi:hypothetical protein
VDDDALAGPQPTVHEQALPGGQSRDRQRRGRHRVDAIGDPRGIARLDRHELGSGSVAVRVAEAEDAIAHGQAGRAVADLRDHPGQLVRRDGRGPVPAGPVDPGAGPGQLVGDETGCVHLHQHVAGRHLRQRRVLDDEAVVITVLVDAYCANRTYLASCRVIGPFGRSGPRAQDDPAGGDVTSSRGRRIHFTRCPPTSQTAGALPALCEAGTGCVKWVVVGE